jgi:NADH:ubiquinone oxidoreductase subunit E
MNQIEGRRSERQGWGDNPGAAVDTQGPEPDLLTDGDGDGADRLIELLQHLQDRRGHLDRHSMEQVAKRLQLSDSKVFGVVSFYHLFRRTPPRLHGCRLCQGTACVVQGGWELRRQLEEELTASDWDLALESCLGVCGQAPLLLLDGVLVGRLPVHDRDAVRSELQRRGVPMKAGGITP